MHYWINILNCIDQFFCAVFICSVQLGINITSEEGINLFEETLANGILKDHDDLKSKGLSLRVFQDGSNAINIAAIQLFGKYLSNNISVRNVFGQNKDQQFNQIVQVFQDNLK